MSENTVDQNRVTRSLPGYEPEIGRWLWALEDVRDSVKNILGRLSQPQLDHQPAVGNGMGTLLYHIALTEMQWLYEVVLQTNMPPEIKRLLPYESRTPDGRLTRVRGEAPETYMERLNATRQALLSAFRGFSLQDWRKPRAAARGGRTYQVSPEWVVYHLIVHEANHCGQILFMLGGG